MSDAIGYEKTSADLHPGPDGSFYPFLEQIVEVRRRARVIMSDTAGAEAPAPVVPLLRQALRIERVCVERYRAHACVSADIPQRLRAQLLQHADEEQQHASWIVARLNALGHGEDCHDRGTASAGAEDDPDATLVDQLEEDIIAERIAIECYREIAAFLSQRDFASCRVFQTILSAEQVHGQELRALRDDLWGRSREATGAPRALTTAGELP